MALSVNRSERGGMPGILGTADMNPRASGGGQRADIVGDDKKSGIYVYLTRLPAGFKVKPQFHPDDRVVTVISGTLLMAYGDKFDETAMKVLPAGSMWTEPAKVPHYVWAKDGEVVIQIVGAIGALWCGTNRRKVSSC